MKPPSLDESIDLVVNMRSILIAYGLKNRDIIITDTDQYCMTLFDLNV